MKKLYVEKSVSKLKHYGKIKSQTQYYVRKFDKTYYPCNGVHTLAKIKEIYKAKGYEVIVQDKGFYKMNY